MNHPVLPFRSRVLWGFVIDAHGPREGFHSFPFSFPCPKYQTSALMPGQQQCLCAGGARVVGTGWVTADRAVLCPQRYLLMQAKPGPWEFHSHVLTTQSPQEICDNIIREKVLEYLPLEVPYGVTQVGNVHRQPWPRALKLGISGCVLRLPLFGSGGDSGLAPQACSKTTLLLCVKGPPLCAAVSRGVVFGVPEGFPGFLSARLLSQVTEIWEEGKCGELLIVQSLLVPRESHKVSGGRKMGCWGG